MVYVRFVNMEGREVQGKLSMDRIPGPGEEIVLATGEYVIQSNPIRNEPANCIDGTLRFMATLTVASKQAPVKPARNSTKAQAVKG